MCFDLEQSRENTHCIQGLGMFGIVFLGFTHRIGEGLGAHRGAWPSVDPVWWAHKLYINTPYTCGTCYLIKYAYDMFIFLLFRGLLTVFWIYESVTFLPSNKVREYHKAGETIYAILQDTRPLLVRQWN